MRENTNKKSKKKKSADSIKEENITTKLKTEMKYTTAISYGPPAGKPSLIQSTYGNKGNFELAVPLATGGIGHYTRDNDSDDLPWIGPTKFGTDAGLIESVSMIQSNFGAQGNLEIVAMDLNGQIMHFWRDSGVSLDWHGPISITQKPQIPIFSGNPAMIQSTFGNRGNFFVVVPRMEGGFSNYWRDNDDSDLSWYGPFNSAIDGPVFEAVTLIQSNFGDIGNLEMVARSGDKLAFFWQDSDLESNWNGPEIIANDAAGTPALIQSTFGNQGNFELVAPMASGGLSHYWRDNDDSHLSWHGPFMFAMNMGKVEAVSLIQSNFGEPGHLEVVALVDGQLAFFWRDSGPDFRWVGPQYLTSVS